VAPELIASEDHQHSDEAVRRIREASHRRIEERNRWRAFVSWCALATLASGISLAALNARDARERSRASNPSTAGIGGTDHPHHGAR
jgi:hypothetical protein